jgi:thioredoxin 1
MLSLSFARSRPQRQLPPRLLATIDRAAFENVILPHDGASLVLFGAAWRPPSLDGTADLQRVADRRRIAALFVDVDGSPELARRCGVTAIPSLVLFHNGQEVARRLGAMSEHGLEDWLAVALP